MYSLNSAYITMTKHDETAKETNQRRNPDSKPPVQKEEGREY